MPPNDYLRPTRRLEDQGVRYPGFAPGSTVLKAGTQHQEGGLALPCDIVFDRDVAMQVSDGTTLYTDLYRPVDGHDLPTIVAWSPYGKRGGTVLLDDYPFRAGVPRSATSGLEKFEAPDPAYWCAHGYAVANPDTRGAFRSEGDIRVWNRREGQDGAEFVDWLGIQDWSNGKVGLCGSSWLAAAQWFIAAERPKSLAAINPWEGLDDVYRDAVAVGGIVDTGFMQWLLYALVGNGNVEDLPARIADHPLADAWQDYSAIIENIEVPAYVVASWANGLHSRGTFDAWRRLSTPNKWLRVHASFEWPDFYQPHNQEDLRRFFDRYLRDLDTGWEATPPVRLDIVDAGRPTIPNQCEDAFPPSRSRPWTLHLDADNRVLTEHPASPSSADYDAVDGALEFTYTFNEDVELVGYPRLILNLQADGSDDIDMFAKLCKVDEHGQPRSVFLVPLHWAENADVADQIVDAVNQGRGGFFSWDGPTTRLRVSHRAVDAAKSTVVPYHPHVTEERLSARQIVEAELGFTGLGMRFNAGETVRLTLTGRNIAGGPPQGTTLMLRNQGRHIVHTGPDTDSRLVLPLSRSPRLSVSDG